MCSKFNQRCLAEKVTVSPCCSFTFWLPCMEAILLFSLHFPDGSKAGCRLCFHDIYLLYLLLINKKASWLIASASFTWKPLHCRECTGKCIHRCVRIYCVVCEWLVSQCSALHAMVWNEAVTVQQTFCLLQVKCWTRVTATGRWYSYQYNITIAAVIPPQLVW